MSDSKLYCIAYGCPKMNRSKNCPLLEIEHLLFKDKIDWINKLDEESRDAILKRHVICTKTRY